MNAGLAIRPGRRVPASGAALSPPASGPLGRYQVLLMAAVLAAMFTNLPIYLYVLDASLLPKFMYFGIALLIFPLLLVHYRDLGNYLASPFALWAILLLALNLIHLAGHSGLLELGGVQLIDTQGEARRSMISTRAQYIVFALLLGFVAYTCTSRSYLWALVPVAILLPCAVMLDFVSPGLLYPLETSGAVFGRAGAMFINPNLAGEAILLSFLLACAVTGAAWRVPLLLLAGAGALATFSRATILAWMLVLLILVAKKTLPKSAMIATAVALAIVLVYLGSFETYLHSRQEFDGASSNILARLNFFSSYSFDDDSSEERAGVILAGWELFLQNPIFGAGAGATFFWSHRGSTHNQLLLLATEYGLLGIFLWAWLLQMLLKGLFFEDKGLQYAMAFLFAFMSLFTHQMFDSSSYWLASFAIVSSRQGASGGRRHAKPIYRYTRQEMLT